METLEQVMAILNKTRSTHIAQGRRAALEIALRQGTVHSRQVYDLMNAKGQIDPNTKDVWLGAVFRCRLFVRTGQKHFCTEEHLHKAELNIWAIAPEYAGLTLEQLVSKGV